MGVELLCLQEARHLVNRSSKYWIAVGPLYASTVITPMTAQVARAAYFFCRHIDDILDGDRIIPYPREYVSSIQKGMEGDSGPRIVDLYKFVMNRVDGVENDFRELIDMMLFDYDRSLEKRILTGQELRDYYRRLFFPVFDIGFRVVGSSLRGNDVSDMVEVLGRLYSIRDMEEDLSKGVINIPKEEIKQSGVYDLSYTIVRSNSHLLRWMNVEVYKQSQELSRQKSVLRTIGNDNGIWKSGIWVCLLLIGAMERYSKRYLQKM